MGKTMKNKIEAKGIEVNNFTQNQENFINLTDIAKYKNPEDPYIVIAKR